MRTNIVLDDQLVEAALECANVQTKRELVHLALQEFVTHHQRHDMQMLKGKVQFDPHYDYKKMRERPF